MAQQEVLVLESGDDAAVEAAERKISQHLQEAKSYFEQSSLIDPDYARALLGIGNTIYEQSWNWALLQKFSVSDSLHRFFIIQERRRYGKSI